MIKLPEMGPDFIGDHNEIAAVEAIRACLDKKESPSTVVDPSNSTQMPKGHNRLILGTLSNAWFKLTHHTVRH